MAYAFASANSRYLSTASAPASGHPMTIACWFNTAAGSQVAVSVGVSSGVHRNQVAIQQSGASVLSQAQTFGSTSNGASNGVNATANVWNHAASVFSSASSRIAYTNGTAGTENTTNVGSINAANSIVIGARWNSTIGAFFSGDIAEVGIWDVALTAAEIASLAKGITCDRIRPDNLVFYAPLIRDLVDKIGGLTITNNNSATVATHTRVYA